MPKKYTHRLQCAVNRKAAHDYFILEKYEAGIELFGTEVKSVRMGNVNLKDSFCTIKDGELFRPRDTYKPIRKGQHIQPRPQASQASSHAQARDNAPSGQDEAGRAYAHTTVPVF